MTTHLSETVVPGTFLAHALAPVPRAVVVIYSRGRFRTAEVVKVGPKRVTVEYVTRHGGTVTRRPLPRAEILRTCYGDDPLLVGAVRERPHGAQYLEEL